MNAYYSDSGSAGSNDPPWLCGICGKGKQDREIKVLSYKLNGNEYITANLKYCADKVECALGALEKSLKGEI